MSVNPLTEARDEYDASIPQILPHSNVYQIHVGSKAYMLSGASLSSDGPSYFTEFFSKEQNKDKVLFVDRSPRVFDYVSLHLQGYYVVPEEDNLYVYLVSDAFYFGLKKLLDILTKDYAFARIGDVPFKISRSLLHASGNHPNYFTINDPLNFNNLYFYQAGNFLRPPPLMDNSVFSRSPELFKDLMEILRGNTTVIKDKHHRDLLVKECKYYRFLQLEQRIINHKIIFNPYCRNVEEIIINVNDIASKGLSIPKALPRQEVEVQYQRPFLPKEPKRDLIFQISNDTAPPFYDVKIIMNKTLKIIITKFSNQICYKFKKLFESFIDESSWISDDSDPLNPTFSFITALKNCRCVINGMTMKPTWVEDILGIDLDDHLDSDNRMMSFIESQSVNSDNPLSTGSEPASTTNGNESSENSTPAHKKRKLIKGDIIEFRVSKSLWKLSFLENNPKLIGVAFEGFTDNNSFINEHIDYL